MPRLRYRSPKSPSSLEERFMRLWSLAGGPPLEKEYRFHDKRCWRADFAQEEACVLIEVKDGMWMNGRQTALQGSTQPPKDT
jgi:hypothetical protein